MVHWDVQTRRRVENTTHGGVFFDEIRGVWAAHETLSRVFDISSQSKQKIISKQRSKIVNSYAKLRPGIQITLTVMI